MKTLIVLAAVALILPSCTTPPHVTGEFISKDGTIKVHPDGRFEIVMNATSAK